MVDNIALYAIKLEDWPVSSGWLQMTWCHMGTRQCWKFPTGLPPEADNFGGGLGTFCWFFVNFMFMIWDSKHEDLQLFLLSFKHWHQAISNHHTDINWPRDVTMAQQSYCTLNYHAMVIKQTILVRDEVSNPLVYLLWVGSSSHDDNT